jgi:N6-L-threonylcarbamoyladenine synthase
LGVNHAVGHIELAKKLAGGKDPLVVYVSGGNTQLIGLQDRRYRVFGETLDIGVGNLLDSFGRAVGIGFPAGPKLDEQYFRGKNLIELPYTVKGMDLVFSGLLTAAQQRIGKTAEDDLAYSLLHTAFAELTEVTERALAHTGKKEVLLTGGVAASKALQEMMKKMCTDRGARLLIPPNWSAGDSGLLPAWLGVVEFEAGMKQPWADTRIDQRQRCDAVEVSWITPHARNRA